MNVYIFQTSTYGLSFVKLHSPPEAGEKEEPVGVTTISL